MAIATINIDIGHGFAHAFPYTDFHEMNLDWLLTTYKSIVDKTNQIITWANNHEIDYEEAIARLAAVENEIYTFEDQINASFERLRADITADFARQKAEMDAILANTVAEVDAKILQLTNEVNAAIASFDYQFEVLKNQILLEVNQLKSEVRQEISRFYDVMQANNKYVFQYVENRLDEFLNSLPEHLSVMVFNPYRGEVTTIQQAIYDLYDVASLYGITAAQYDSLDLSAEDYDALNLTAQQYDTMAYKLLYHDPDVWMINPFTGQEAKIKDVVYELSLLHMQGLTATEYDAKDLDADTYDGLDLTAFGYDWLSKELIP